MDVSLETVLYIFVTGSGLMILWLTGVQPTFQKWQDIRRSRAITKANQRHVTQPQPDFDEVRELIATEIETRLATAQNEITLAGQSETPAADLAALGRSRRRRSKEEYCYHMF